MGRRAPPSFQFMLHHRVRKPARHSTSAPNGRHARPMAGSGNPFSGSPARGGRGAESRFGAKDPPLGKPLGEQHKSGALRIASPRVQARKRAPSPRPELSAQCRAIWMRGDYSPATHTARQALAGRRAGVESHLRALHTPIFRGGAACRSRPATLALPCTPRTIPGPLPEQLLPALRTACQGGDPCAP